MATMVTTYHDGHYNVMIRQFNGSSHATVLFLLQEKWLKVQEQKDRRDRRDPPPPPEELDRPLPTRPEEIDAFNQRMSDIYNGFSLMKCDHCGRTMLPDVGGGP